MKKLYIYLILSIGFLISAQAQISLTCENHGLMAGDKHHFKLAKNNVDVGPAGAKQVWDFSNLEVNGDLTSFMLDAKETPKSDALPEANTVIEEFNNKFYFNVNEGIIEQQGFVGCGGRVLHYDKPFVKMIYPFTYGDIYDGEFSGQYINKDGKKGAKISGWYSLEADGYGTLLLPGDVKINNVLRLKTTRGRSFNNGTEESVTTTYRWYAEDVRYPLLSIIQKQNGDDTKNIRTAYYANAESSKEKEKEGKSLISSGSLTMRYYPNPFKDELKIDYKLDADSKVKIELYNNSGQKATELVNSNQQKGFYSLNINADGKNLNPGIYHIRVTLDGKLITTETIILVE